MPTQYMLKELLENIREGDLIKATVVLSKLGAVPPEMQHRVLFELSRCEGYFAIPLLGYVLADVSDLVVPQQSVRDVLCDKILDAPEEFLKLLEEPRLQNKAPLIELAGSMRFEAAVPYLITLLARETHPDLLVALLQALGSIGHPAAVEAVTEYLYANTRSLVSTAAHTLAQLGTPDAVEHLVSRMGGDSDLDRMILDALAEMNSDLALEKISHLLGCAQAALRTRAKTTLQKLGARSIPALSKTLLGADQDAVIHALNTLGTIGDAAATQPIRQLLHNEPKDANVRFAAYEALGMLPLHKGAFVLAEGLDDPVEDVRIAAARAIERHHNDIIIAGIANLVHQADAKAHCTAEALMNAKADRLFLSLINDEAFRDMALDYLMTRAHPDLRGHFETLLRQHGHGAYAVRLSVEPEAAASDRLVIYAVDDSRMILSIYKKTLYELGYEVHLFEFPAAAIEQVQQAKPALVFTDLNMPEITGVELTETLRTWHTKEELPIVMVTTQSEGQDHDAAYTAGVNTILHKPFTAEQLEAVIEEQVRRG